MKRIVCDSSSLISMSSSCMLQLLGYFKNVRFIVPRSVENEIRGAPMMTRRFKLSALKFQHLLNTGIIEVEEADQEEAKRFLERANTVFWLRGKPIKMIHLGEAEALALATDADALLIDERTLRLFIETPSQLLEMLRKRIGKKIQQDSRALNKCVDSMEDAVIIRSSEIVAAAYENGILEECFGEDGKDLLEACLWALKFSGCSITNNEIDEYLRITD